MSDSKDKDKKPQMRIACYFLAATPKAFLAEFRDEDGDRIGERWLPHSQCKQVVNGCEGFVVSGDRGDSMTVTIPDWLLDKPELQDMCKYQIQQAEMEAGGTGDYDDDIPF